MSRSSPNYASLQGTHDTLLSHGAAPNGRIDLFSPLPSFQIPTYQQRTVRNDRYAEEATYGQITPNDLSRLYFSETNINALQEGIRYRVYVETQGKYTLGRQSDQELKIVMRSVYLQYGKNLPSDMVAQVRTLNAKVLEWTVPEVLSNLKQYETYRRDASSLPVPMEHAALMTSKGTRTLEIKSFF